MTFPKARLVVSACLFLGWLGFLLFLVIDSRKVVLSKPQFMAARIYAVAEMHLGRGGAIRTDGTIVEVLWSADPADRSLVGQPIALPAMNELNPSRSYQPGEARFLLPLNKTADGKLELAALPRLDSRQQPTHGTLEVSGLFSHRVMQRLPLREAQTLATEWDEAGFKTAVSAEELRIYPWTPDVQTQLERLIAAR